MSFPPMLMRLKVIDPERRVNLWLPLFLVWIFILIVAIALSPLIVVLVILLWPWGWGEMLLLLGPAVYRILCALRGLSVDIRKPDQIVLIYFK
jgi:hypothetical protein